mmetsp:Transcript_2287/g.2950  ORF Transcript_2287/g.2950 Transcript_2287/m.2950 type:complete len:270 (-) Transcript_2287:77-886(-)|eukprot:CAMPEP_0172490030 /NCGR_PEP_ID=MMETSP1066-20121228/20364_1 /TAXON_ID=671091 /ORGANISM="Coscinodiscus wailesii, Strain CCMP2513" /LENGTH=269 /DNA_ID=CAMNT_0013258309 /DNA_START=36 /DNA_END=845 /DNA_ORIENTATION=+
MKLSVLAPVFLTTLFNQYDAFTPSAKSLCPIRHLVQKPNSGLFMSDDQPSDSSSENMIEVETVPFEPTAAETLVTSILDDIPATLMEDISKESRSSINEALLKLEAVNPTENPATSNLLNGVWMLRYSGGYSSDWALSSPTRQIALFLYSGGYSPGLFALYLAKQLPSALVEVGELEINISREQPRIQAEIPVKFLGGSESEIMVKARLDVVSGVRMAETYEKVVNLLDRELDIPTQAQYSRDLYITYLDDDLMVVRDASGIPEILVRK